MKVRRWLIAEVLIVAVFGSVVFAQKVSSKDQKRNSDKNAPKWEDTKEIEAMESSGSSGASKRFDPDTYIREKINSAGYSIYDGSLVTFNPDVSPFTWKITVVSDDKVFSFDDKRLPGKFLSSSYGNKISKASCKFKYSPPTTLPQSKKGLKLLGVGIDESIGIECQIHGVAVYLDGAVCIHYPKMGSENDFWDSRYLTIGDTVDHGNLSISISCSSKDEK